ncbi:MAG: TlpA family protein disulfide reductase [Acidobacteria bacterium]|nr:TlpA family protein disulfide reductase [Acidobacteriota bacterium]
MPRLLRIAVAVFLSVLLLSAGFVYLVYLSLYSSPLWFWPVALAVFGSLWFLIRKRLDPWISANAFLMVSVPGLLLLLAFHLQLTKPNLQVPASQASLEIIPEEKRKTTDLDVVLRDLEGHNVSLNDYRNRALFLNFWATWCAPCRAEMPEMAELYKQYAPHGLSMVAVTDEDPATVTQFLKNNSYPFPVLIDPGGTLNQKLSVMGLPTTYIIDSEGRIILHRVGLYHWNSRESLRLFEQLLKK